MPSVPATPDVRIAFLAGVELFNELTHEPEALREFSAIMIERKYAPKTMIIGEGLESPEMFFLMDGRADVFKTTPEGDSFKVAILDCDHHAFFGEGGLIDSKARSATIYAETECHCLVLRKQDFDVFCGKFPQWALPFFRRISSTVLSRLKKTNNDLALLYKALIDEIKGT